MSRVAPKLVKGKSWSKPSDLNKGLKHDSIMYHCIITSRRVLLLMEPEDNINTEERQRFVKLDFRTFEQLPALGACNEVLTEHYRM